MSSEEIKDIYLKLAYCLETPLKEKLSTAKLLEVEIANMRILDGSEGK